MSCLNHMHLSKQVYRSSLLSGRNVRRLCRVLFSDESRRALYEVRKKTRQTDRRTDGRTPYRYITLSVIRGRSNNVQAYMTRASFSHQTIRVVALLFKPSMFVNTMKYPQFTILYDTIRYIYVRSKADEMASLV